MHVAEESSWLSDESAILETAINPRGLIEALPVAVYTTDVEGRILLYNEAAVRLWGRRPEIGKDLWSGSKKLFTPEGEPLPLEACSIALTLRENRPVRDIEVLIERPDGSRSLVLPWPSPLKDDEGRLIGAVNVLVDITDAREAEEAKLRLAAIVESSNDAVVSKDLNGIIKSWNRAAEEIFGYTAEEAVGRSIMLIIPPERRQEEDDVLAKIRSGEAVKHFETVRRHKDGRDIDISLTVSPVKSSDGRIIGASKTARDITGRKAEEALRSSMEIKDEFLGLVSHELSTPIATILGNSKLLLKRGEQLDEADKRQALQDVVSEAEKLQGNIEHMLALTRLETIDLELEPISLPALVAKSADQFTQRYGRPVSVYRDQQIRPALGNETLVSLVLQNLLSNADKYTPAGSSIEVSLSLNQDGSPEVHIRDNGIGLDEEDMANLFTPFYRSGRAKRTANGFGLGLTVCKRALEAQGGKIGAAGKPGGGSDFYFCLPSAEAVAD